LVSADGTRFDIIQSAGNTEPSDLQADDMEDGNPPIDLEALELYMNSDLAADDCMGLSDLDGFLTAIVIGPELILSSEWLPVIWGGMEPDFETDIEMRMVIGTIIGHYEEIATCFDSDPYQFEPLFLGEPNGEVIVADWVAGFLDGVTLRPEAWKVLTNHRDAGILMEPFLVLSGNAELTAGRDSAVDKARFMAEAPDLISACVLGIHEFWKNSRGRTKPAPGRNSRSKR
jgi:uncharacterized protein